MTISETIWLAVAISGFVLFLEAVFIGICALCNKKFPEWASRAGAGLFLLILAIVYLKTNPPLWLSNLPPCLSWAVVGLLLLVFAFAIVSLRRKKRRKAVMRLKITEKKEREIEYCVKAAMYFFGVGLGSATLVGIWNTLGLIDSWGWALQMVSILFLAAATAAFCFEVKHLRDEKRNS